MAGGGSRRSDGRGGSGGGVQGRQSLFDAVRGTGVAAASPGDRRVLVQWNVRPESMTAVWPVIVSVRHIVTTISAQSSLSAAFFNSDVAAD